MDDRITIQCPACNAKLAVSSQHAGKKLKCPKCGELVLVLPLASELNPTDSVNPSTPHSVEKQFVVRYAVDVVSDPMSADELVEALHSGKLNRQMLFSEAGSAKWRPLSFVAPEPAKPKRSDTKMAHPNYLLPRLVCLCGLMFCVLGIVESAAAVIGGALISIGAWWIVYIWLNAFFTNVQILLWKIAHTDED